MKTIPLAAGRNSVASHQYLYLPAQAADHQQRLSVNPPAPPVLICYQQETRSNELSLVLMSFADIQPIVTCRVQSVTKYRCLGMETHLRTMEPHLPLWDHTCHPTQVNALCLNPSHQRLRIY